MLVNIGFETCGLPYPEDQMRRDFELIESHYEGDGWYFDYFNQREYYTMWAFHYYGLIYALVMKDRDPRRSEVFLERGRLMAKDFACWFDSCGEALPYGRSRPTVLPRARFTRRWRWRRGLRRTSTTA